jgi:hypothetical protein
VRGEVHTGFGCGNLREIDHLEDPGVDGTIIFGYSRNGIWGMDWIDLAENRDGWRALVNVVMNLRVP